MTISSSQLKRPRHWDSSSSPLARVASVKTPELTEPGSCDEFNNVFDQERDGLEAFNLQSHLRRSQSLAGPKETKVSVNHLAVGIGVRHAIAGFILLCGVIFLVCDAVEKVWFCSCEGQCRGLNKSAAD